MVTTVARGVLYVHSSPRALCPHVEWAAGHAIGRPVEQYGSTRGARGKITVL